MLVLDRARFLFSLAGAAVRGDWTAAALRGAIVGAAAGYDLRTPGLAPRVLKCFPEKPRYGALLAFLVGDLRLTRALSRLVAPRRSRTPAPQQALPLPPLPTEAALAAWLNLTAARLRWLADLTGRNRRHPPGPLRTYRYRWVAKPNGRARLLEVPVFALKQAQRRVLTDLLNLVPPHPTAHGFRPGHSAITNASAHCGRAVILKFDLADFFPSVAAARVVRIFRTVGYLEPVARLLAGLCTTRTPADVWAARPHPAADGSDHAARLRLIGRHLPQGAPTSPALANLAAHRLDRRLAGLAAALDATYTRYADDLTFSGDDALARHSARLSRLVASVVAEEGFTLNAAKTRVIRRAARQVVTGLVVNVRPNLSRAAFDTLKAILTNCVRRGTAGENRAGAADFRAHLAGRVAHAAAVNPTRGRKLWRLFDAIRWEACRPS